MSTSDTWRAMELTPGDPVLRQFGPLGLWLRRHADEWHVGVDRRERKGPPSDTIEPEETMEWERVALGRDLAEVQFAPIMPDRPVVVRPEHELVIAAGAECVLYVNVPQWVKVTAGPEGALPLGEFPTLILSNTWFGEPTEGELCFSVKTTARRNLQDVPKQPHRVVCPVRVKNTSTEPLALERFCLRVEHLGVYSSATRLWAPESKLEYLGDDRFSRVEYAESVGESAGEATLIGPPRTPPETGTIRRSFSRLRDLAQTPFSW